MHNARSCEGVLVIAIKSNIRPFCVRPAYGSVSHGAHNLALSYPHFLQTKFTNCVSESKALTERSSGSPGATHFVAPSRPSAHRTIRGELGKRMDRVQAKRSGSAAPKCMKTLPSGARLQRSSLLEGALLKLQLLTTA
eukprot:6181189-Pleurochrysis_carterae.AAC.1